MLVLCCAPAVGEPVPPIRVLIVDGFSNHDWQLTTDLVRRIVTPTGLFEVSVSTSPPTLDSPGWDTWRPRFTEHEVVLLNCNSLGNRPTWPRAVEEALETYVAAGGGLFVFHSANNSFAHWPEYNRMIGLGWRPADGGYALTVGIDGNITRIPPGEGEKTYHGPRVDAVLHRVGDHPIQAGFPARWMTPDLEIYKYARGPAENLRVLSYAYDADTDKNWPVEWTVTYGKGRVYNGSLGHVWTGDTDPVSMRCVAFQTTLIRALQWLAGREASWPVPREFPSEQAVSLVPPNP
jgi:type 1 glutamine amidotransferase